ncbi:MAG TPA: hypothetical protein VN776_09940 [Terracidiphilus sp.]|nr:hypothetical protein [Terracidiphilus sp.]
MVRRFRNPLACAVVALAALNCTALPGQSGAGESSTGFSVRSAVYNPAANTVVVELANDTQRSVTAYGLDITVTAGGKAIAHTGYGADLLNLILNARSKKGAADSWDGAIRPGGVHTDTIPANVLAEAEVTGPVEVRVDVTVVLWSDGAVEGTNQFMIRQMQDGRQATLRAEGKVLSILDAHSGDPEIQSRIGGVLNDLALLVKGPEPGADVPASEMLNSAVLSDAVANLTKIRSSNNAAAQLQAYAADFTAQHERRVALTQSMA